MAEGNQLLGTAITIGVIGLIGISVGAFMALTGDQDTSSATSGILIRAGAVLAAVSLVLPTIGKPSLSTMAVAAVGLALVLARPGLVWAALVGWVVWILLSRQRKTADSDS